MARRIVPLLVALLPLGCGRTPPPVAVVPPAFEPIGDVLAAPVLLEADGRPLVNDGSFSQPFLGDIDGDGRPDLLVGSGTQGRLLVFRNVGSRTEPKLGGSQWFDDKNPTGRVPKG